MLETKRNFLIIENIRDGFSIKRSVFSSAVAEKIVTTKQDFVKLSPRGCKIEWPQPAIVSALHYNAAICSKPRQRFPRLEMYRYEFPRLHRYWILNNIHKTILFLLSYVFAEQQQHKNVKIIPTLKSLSDFTNTHNPVKSCFLLSSS